MCVFISFSAVLELQIVTVFRHRTLYNTCYYVSCDIRLTFRVLVIACQCAIGSTVTGSFNLYAPCILYIGQTYRYSPEYAFCICSQQIYLIIFLDFLSPSSFIPPQNVVYFLMLPFLVHNIFTFYLMVC